MINPLKLRRANKKLNALLDKYHKSDKSVAPSKFVGMTHQEFQKWCATEIPPERFLK